MQENECDLNNFQFVRQYKMQIVRTRSMLRIYRCYTNRIGGNLEACEGCRFFRTAYEGPFLPYSMTVH